MIRTVSWIPSSPLNQAVWNGTLDLPFNHGGSRRASVICPQVGAGCDASIHSAAAQESHVVIGRSESPHDDRKAGARQTVVSSS